MKYCPYCGADIVDGAVSFCSECGKELPVKKQKENQESIPEKKPAAAKKKKSKKRKTAPPSDAELRSEYEEGYDGYYEDLLPIDDGKVHIGIDKALIKKIIILAAAVLMVIVLCVIMMYLL